MDLLSQKRTIYIFKKKKEKKRKEKRRKEKKMLQFLP